MRVADQAHGRDTEMQNLGEDPEMQKNQNKDQQLRKMLKKLDQNLHDLRKHAFVLVNLYYFFQGAILTAVSQVSSPKCHQWHFFSILSSISFLLNGVPLLYTMCKYVETKNECDMYKLLREWERASGSGHGPIRDGYRGTIRYGGVVVVALFLVGFNAAILYGCRSLLCEHTDTMPRMVTFDCFSLCNSENKCLEICTS